MSQKEVNEELALAASRLADAHSGLWGDFLKALDASAKVEVNALVSVASTHIFAQQGRAQAMQELHGKLVSCREVAKNVISLRQQKSAKATN